MNKLAQYRPPRTTAHRSTHAYDEPEAGQRFANRATALAFAAWVSVAGSLAAVGLADWLMRGKGSEVGLLSYTMIFGVFAFLLVMAVQQIGPSIHRRLRPAILVFLAAVTVASPVAAILLS